MVLCCMSTVSAITTTCVRYLSTQLVGYNNISLLKPHHFKDRNMRDRSKASAVSYELSPQYASGDVHSSSVLDTVLCQAFYNPSLVSFLQYLMTGRRDDASVAAAEVDGTNSHVAGHPLRPGCRDTFLRWNAFNAIKLVELR